MLKENKIPGINDNASREELLEMMEDLLKNGPIEMDREMFDKDNGKDKKVSIA